MYALTMHMGSRVEQVGPTCNHPLIGVPCLAAYLCLVLLLLMRRLLPSQIRCHTVLLHGGTRGLLRLLRPLRHLLSCGRLRLQTVHHALQGGRKDTCSSRRAQAMHREPWGTHGEA